MSAVRWPTGRSAGWGLSSSWLEPDVLSGVWGCGTAETRGAQGLPGRPSAGSGEELAEVVEEQEEDRHQAWPGPAGFLVGNINSSHFS